MNASTNVVCVDWPAERKHCMICSVDTYHCPRHAKQLHSSIMVRISVLSIDAFVFGLHRSSTLFDLKYGDRTMIESGSDSMNSVEFLLRIEGVECRELNAIWSQSIDRSI